MEAENCRMMSGALRSWRSLADLYTPSPQSTWPPYQTIFRYQTAAQRAAGTASWLTWSEAVHAVMTPIPNDQYDRLYFTGTGAPQVTSSDLVASGSGAYPQDSYNIGVPAPLTAPTLAKSGTATSSDPTLAITRACVYTWVNEYGEESAPSPVSDAIECYPGEQWDISGLETSYSSSYRPEDEKRIYLTNTGSTGTEYQLVETVTVAATSATAVSQSFSNFGEVLGTDGWLPPPSDMVGVISLPWGALAGFAPNNPLGGSGNAVYLSHPYQCHAWLTEYAFAVPEQIQALAAFGNSIVVLTNGLPTVATGVDPAALSFERLGQGHACTSGRGVATVDGEVMYPCPQGLAGIGVNGVRLLTEEIITSEEWASYYPYTIHGYEYNGHYVGFFDSSYTDGAYPSPRPAATRGGFVFHPTTGQFATLSGLEATAGHSYLGGDYLGLHVYSDSEINLFDAHASNRLTYAWKSRPGFTPYVVGMGAMRVYADSYPVTVEIYTDGSLGYTVAVSSETPVRLPETLEGRRWQVRLTGSAAVNEVTLATSIEELGQQ